MTSDFFLEFLEVPFYENTEYHAIRFSEILYDEIEKFKRGFFQENYLISSKQ